MNKPKIISEKETREKIANSAFLLGGDAAYKDVLAIYDKYDKAIKKCTNEEEKKHIKECGIAELHRYFQCRGELVVNGKLLIPAEKDFVPNKEFLKE